MGGGGPVWRVLRKTVLETGSFCYTSESNAARFYPSAGDQNQSIYRHLGGQTLRCLRQNLEEKRERFCDIFKQISLAALEYHLSDISRFVSFRTYSEVPFYWVSTPPPLWVGGGGGE